METIEKNVVLLLNGKDAEEPQDFCDFTLEDQNEAASKFLLLLLFVFFFLLCYVLYTLTLLMHQTLKLV